jgi:hypothetical protein
MLVYKLMQEELSSEDVKQVSRNARKKRGRAALADMPDPIPPRRENRGAVTQPHGASRQARVQSLKSVSLQQLSERKEQGRKA